MCIWECVFVWYNSGCVWGEGMCPITIMGTNSKTEWGPWRNRCQKGSRGVCGNQWDDGPGLSCASHLESSPLISGPETLANQFSPANKYYVGWQNSSVQMSCRTRCCFKLWMAALPCGPRPAQALCGPRGNPDCVGEPITLFVHCRSKRPPRFSLQPFGSMRFLFCFHLVNLDQDWTALFVSGIHSPPYLSDVWTVCTVSDNFCKFPIPTNSTTSVGPGFDLTRSLTVKDAACKNWTPQNHARKQMVDTLHQSNR